MARSWLRDSAPLALFALDRRLRRQPQRRPTRRYLKRHGHTVLNGPWKGLKYDPLTARVANDVAAKLLGSYEEELHGALSEAIAAEPRTFIDVGCAEGYHAVGAARALPGACVRAFDNDGVARRLCERLVAANDVGDRVDVGSTFGIDAMRDAESPVLLLMDCEGCESMLLSGETKRRLAGVTLIVELHEWAVPGIERGLLDLYADTHEVETIRAAARYRAQYPELDTIGRLNDVETDLLLSERRPTPMAWTVMRPRVEA
jgi:hypothetical protein